MAKESSVGCLETEYFFLDGVLKLWSKHNKVFNYESGYFNNSRLCNAFSADLFLDKSALKFLGPLKYQYLEVFPSSLPLSLLFIYSFVQRLLSVYYAWHWVKCWRPRGKQNCLWFMIGHLLLTYLLSVFHSLPI